MKNQDKEKKTSAKHVEADFNGYTMEELRYQLAMVAIKKEYLKERALQSTTDIKKQLNSHMPLRGLGSKGIFGKVMKGLDLADYIMLGFQGFKIVRKIGSIFRKRR